MFISACLANPPLLCLETTAKDIHGPRALREHLLTSELVKGVGRRRSALFGTFENNDSQTCSTYDRYDR